MLKTFINTILLVSSFYCFASFGQQSNDTIVKIFKPTNPLGNFTYDNKSSSIIENINDLKIKERAASIGRRTDRMTIVFEDIKQEIVQEATKVNTEGDTSYNYKMNIQKLFINENYTPTTLGLKFESALDYQIDFFNKEYYAAQLALDSTEKSHHFPSLTKDGQEEELFNKDPELSKKTFLQLNFEDTPMIAALAVITEKQSKMALYETEVLLLLYELDQKKK